MPPSRVKYFFKSAHSDDSLLLAAEVATLVYHAAN